MFSKALTDGSCGSGKQRFLLFHADQALCLVEGFFLPADGTLVGSQHVAWELGATDLYRDLRSIARNDNNIALGVFAVLWWLLIGKTLLSMGGVFLRVFRRSELE